MAIFITDAMSKKLTERYYRASAQTYDLLNLDWWAEFGTGGAMPAVGTTAMDSVISTALTAQSLSTTGGPNDRWITYWNNYDLSGTTLTFFDDFETGDRSKWVTTTGSPRVQASDAWAGSFGAGIATSLSASVLGTSTTKWSQSAFTWASVALRWRWNTLPQVNGISGSIFTLANVLNVQNLDFYRDIAANANYTSDIVNADRVTFPLSAVHETGGGWNLVQARYFVGDVTYTSQTRINGGAPISNQSTGLTATHIRSLVVGDPGSSQTMDFSVDQVRVTLGTADPGWVSLP